MTKIVNLTPHPVNVIIGDRYEVTFPPSGIVARVVTEQTLEDRIVVEEGLTRVEIPVVRTEFGDVVGVPSPCSNCKRFDECSLTKYDKEICNLQKPEELYIVSSLVAMALSGRKDIIAPDTSPDGVVRDETGKVIGVRGFQRW